MTSWEKAWHWPAPQQREDVRLEVTPAFVRDILSQGTGRVGEVILVLRRPDGRILLHTKRFYPAGVWRLPSGGIRPGETPPEAALREVGEETSLSAEIERPLGVLTYELVAGRVVVPFASVPFLLRPSGGEPAAQDALEEISGYRWVTMDELATVTRQLEQLPPSWSDWGAFRAAGHRFVLARLGTHRQ